MAEMTTWPVGPLVSKKYRDLSACGLTIYICVIVSVILVVSVYKIRTDSIFSCQADGYDADRYLGYCNGAHYGDYEHGAFYFDLEPSARNFARDADVLFLGNSRLQLAFSTTATATWFSSALIKYYLLGFSSGENATFAEALLRKIGPLGRVYIINVDDFFEAAETAPAKAIFHDPDARSRYESRRLWQRVHAPVCKTFPVLCGTDSVLFRSRETGMYEMRVVKQRPASISYEWDVTENTVNIQAARAAQFLSHLPIERRCLILTMVPTVGTKIGNARAIAKALGEELLVPEIQAGLLTFDQSHLDQTSAQQWSQAFFQIAGSRIRSCLEQQAARATADVP
jgi:hypothetical protein